MSANTAMLPQRRAAAQTPRASARGREGAPGGGPRVVYFIASHVHPEQVVRLVRACRSGSPQSRVLLHHDYSVSHLDPASVHAFGNVDILPSQKNVGWGSFGTCAMIMRSMRWLLDHHDFDWVIHLSGQDYPIQPLADFEDDLANSTHDGYVLTWPVEQTQWDVGPARYLYQYYDMPRLKGWLTVRQWIRRHERSRVQAGGLPYACVAPTPNFRLGVRAFHGPFRNGFRCHKGSSWWTLSRRALEYMIRYAEENTDLVRYYRRVQFAPNESFFQTILRNNPTLDLFDHNRRFIRWSHAESGHPDTLTSADFGEMADSGYPFARKIDSRKDPEILDLLDARVGVGATVTPAFTR